MKFKPIAIVLKLAAAGLLVGAMWRHQNDYYTLMAWVVCGVAALGAFQAMACGKGGWAFTLYAVALCFIPLSSNHSDRETWAFIDAAAAVILLVSIAFVNRHRTPT